MNLYYPNSMLVDPKKLGKEVASFDRLEIFSALQFVANKIENALFVNGPFRICKEELIEHIKKALNFDENKANILSEYLCSKITKGIEEDRNLKKDFERIVLVQIFEKENDEFSCLEIYDTEAVLNTKVGHC